MDRGRFPCERRRPWRRALPLGLAAAGLVSATLALPAGAGPATSGAVSPGATGAGSWAPPGTKPAEASYSYASVPDGTEGRIAGTAIGADSALDGASLAKLRADGLNTVSLYVWWETGSDPTKVVQYSDTEPDSALGAEISAVQAAGFRVVMTPVFWCATCSGGWRGDLRLNGAGQVNAFFASYTAFVQHYADIAQRYGVSMYFVGSELSMLEGERAHWLSLISDIRGHYHGRLAYEENWDMLGRASFLSQVDDIAISAYFPLDDRPAPTLAQLVGDWTSSHAAATAGRNWVGALTHLAASLHRPILFGEAGYMSGQYAARAPYLDYYGQPDWQVQADLYQALLETFSRQPWWAGAIWYDWEYGNDTLADGRTYRAKTAEELLTMWYGEGMRPTSPTESLIPGGS